MKNLFSFLLFGLSFLFLSSCNTSPTADIEGVYETNKEAFIAGIKATLNANDESDPLEENSFLIELMEEALDQAKIEVEIKGDSIKGIIFFMEESKIMQSKIRFRNDSLFIEDQGEENYIIKTEKGISIRSGESEIGLELQKTEFKSLSEETKALIRDKK